MAALLHRTSLDPKASKGLPSSKVGPLPLAICSLGRVLRPRQREDQRLPAHVATTPTHQLEGPAMFPGIQ
jgi:hypothetical protein